MTTYHSAFNGLGNIAKKHHTLLTGSKEHKEVFPVPPVVAFRRCKNLKDILVRARLTSGREKVHNNRGSSCCKKSRCQVCKVMSNSDTFKSSTTGKEYKINYSFNCDSSNDVYLIDRGFLNGISVKVVDRLTGNARRMESFWQYRLNTFSPLGLNTRQVDT